MSRPVLQCGSSGEYVAGLQEFLSDLGYDIDVDGIFGDHTAQAVMAFQKQYGASYSDEMVYDGIVGPDTWALIDAVSEGEEEEEEEEEA